METETVAQRLANWVARLDSAQVPNPVRAIARACMVDTLGVAVGGVNENVSRLVRDHVLSTYAAGGSTVIGTAGGHSVSAAAFANATAAHALDFDDNCYAGLVHGSAVVAPAVLAIAESRAASGADLTTAFIAGVEVEYALGAALTQSIYDRGWWTTGVLGAIGAAAGAAKALRLTAAQTASAIAIAAAGTGGARACLGSDAKPILAGRAAEAGVAAASLAMRGAAGPLRVFEDARGVAKLFNGDRFDDSALTTLGVSWRLQTPGIDVKKYPVCLSGHAAADGVLDVMREHRLVEADVATVTCTVPAIVGANLTYGLPSTSQQAQFSLPFAAACMMVHGAVTLDHLRAEALADEVLVRAMKKVRMVVAENWPDHVPREVATSGPEAAVVRLTTVDGRTMERFTGWARGMAARPLAEEELDAKFMLCAGRALRTHDASALLARVKAIEALTDVRQIFRDLAPKFVVNSLQRSQAGGATCGE
jgi:2-methylcitrate dehydratase PrpD